MENENFDKVITLLNKEVDGHLQIIRESEERVGKVNSMVERLHSIMDGIESAYEKHIDNLVSLRDKLVEENATLIEQNAKLMARVDRMENKYNALQSEYINYLKTQASLPANNVNVYKND